MKDKNGKGWWMIPWMIAVLVVGLLLAGCGSQGNSIQTVVDFAPTIDITDLNDSLLITQPQGIEQDFKINLALKFIIQNNSDTCILFPIDYGLRVFLYNVKSKDWEEIGTRTKIETRNETMLCPKGQGTPWQTDIAVLPDISNSDKPVEIRILVSGEKLANDIKAKSLVAAFYDFTLFPSEIPSCKEEIPPYNATVLPTPMPEDATVIVNEGMVCFDTISPETRIVFHLATDRCYMPLCTLIFERNGRIEVNHDSATIQIYTKFVVKDISLDRGKRGCGCSEGCEGAGEIEFDARVLDELDAGTYRIRLGEDEIGVITIPIPPNSYICFDSEESRR